MPPAPPRRRTRQRTLGGVGGGRSPPTCGRDSGRWEGGGATGGGQSPPPTGEGGKAQVVCAGREKEPATDTGCAGGLRGACQFDPRNTLRGLGEGGSHAECYKCETQVITLVNFVVTSVNDLAKGITNVNGTT